MPSIAAKYPTIFTLDEIDLYQLLVIDFIGTNFIDVVIFIVIKKRSEKIGEIIRHNASKNSKFQTKTYR